MRNWLIQIGFFLALNVLLLIVDGTPLVQDIAFGSFGDKMLQTKLFTDWFHFYDTPFFNVVLLFALAHVLLFPFYGIKLKKQK
ncbi:MULTISPECIES: YfzA family protein [Gracilibacillus]|uniref:YfzA family protein n=1 Tax=Gracilibacillus TaxID=74385 RepID=UPI0008266E2B|nr:MULTISPECIES: YfzA family protein [Gracilibacillus]